jgi:hypothetical protein
MKNLATTMDKDTVANLVTASAVTLSLTDTQIWLTVASLATAVILNVVRIVYTILNGKNKS